MRINGYGVRGGWIIVAGFAALAASSPGDIIEPRILRSLDVEATAVSGDETVLVTPKAILSDAFGLFDLGHDAAAETSDGRAGSGILATQETFAEPDGVHGRLSTGASARTVGELTGARAAGASTVGYSFVLTEPARFALEGVYIAREAEGFFANHSSIALVPLSGSDFEPILLDNPGPFRFLGVLPRGEYRLEVETNLVVESEGGGLSSLVAVIEFRFGIGVCPADMNADGVLDADDFFTFLDLFAERDPSVDFNHDGQLDLEDFFAYLDLFVEGCR